MERKVAAARITGQSVKLYDEQGVNICSIPASDAVSANASGDRASITFKNGSVKIYDAKGQHKATIPG